MLYAVRSLLCMLQGKRINDVVNRMHVAMPKPRDGAARPPVIPASVQQARAHGETAGKAKRKTEKDLQVQFLSPTPSAPYGNLQ